MIIDAHAHVFREVHGMIGRGPTRGLDYGRVAIGDEVTRVLPPYCEKTVFTPDMLVACMDWSGVDQAVLLQGSFYGECNAYVMEAVQRFPERLSGALFCDPWKKDGRQDLEAYLDTQQFSAVKIEFSVATGLCGIYPQARLDAPDIRWLWRLLEERDVTLVLDLGEVGSRSYQTGAVDSIAKEHPGLKIVIAHLGQVNRSVETDPRLWPLWQEQIDLGRLPNVWFDCAALAAYFPEEDYPFPSVGRYLKQAIERIGPAKVLWGSDVPGLLTSADYPQLVKMAKVHLGFLSAEEQTMVFAKNAQGVFNI